MVNVTEKVLKTLWLKNLPFSIESVICSYERPKSGIDGEEDCRNEA